MRKFNNEEYLEQKMHAIQCAILEAISIVDPKRGYSAVLERALYKVSAPIPQKPLAMIPKKCLGFTVVSSNMLKKILPTSDMHRVYSATTLFQDENCKLTVD